MNSAVTKYICNSHCCANEWGVCEEAPSSVESATHHCTFPYSENEKTDQHQKDSHLCMLEMCKRENSKQL